MAQVKGPSLSLGALGRLGQALSFSSTMGKQIAKKTPRSKKPRSRAQLAASEVLRFFSNSWVNDFARGIGNPDWLPLADARKITAANIFIGTNLERTSHGDGPTQTPDISPPATPGNISFIGVKQSARTITLTVHFTLLADTWGTWLYLTDPAAVGPTARDIATSCNVITLPAASYTCRAIVDLAPGSQWVVWWQQFTGDGTYDALYGPIGPYTIP
jgi:hypothetical protein